MYYSDVSSENLQIHFFPKWSFQFSATLSIFVEVLALVANERKTTGNARVVRRRERGFTSIRREKKKVFYRASKMAAEQREEKNITF